VSCKFTYVFPACIAATRSSNVIVVPSAFFAVASGAVNDPLPVVDLSVACVTPDVSVTTIVPGLPGVVSRWMWNPDNVPFSGVELSVQDIVVPFSVNFAVPVAVDEFVGVSLAPVIVALNTV
jgi:hypothetical protein